MPSTLTFITESLPQFTVGEFKEFDIEASGGSSPYTFEITQGSLPSGLTLDSDGTISGTPEEAGTFTPFFKLTDSAGDHLTQAMEVQVADSGTGTTTTSTLTFITESIPQFTVGVFQEFALEASGGTPPYTFEITQGNLPQGLNLDADGTISGTAEVAGTFTPFFKLTDSAGDHLTQTLEVTVTAGGTSTAYAS